jgi:hypothetical protein
VEYRFRPGAGGSSALARTKRRYFLFSAAAASLDRRSGAIAPPDGQKEGVCFAYLLFQLLLGKVEKYIAFPLHARELSGGNLNSQQAILSRPKHALGCDKLPRETSETVSEPAIIVHNEAADDIYK